MINLFHIPNYKVSTENYNHLLHGSIVQDFEEAFCSYVGAKYGVAVNSATNAIFLSLLNKDVTCKIPTVIPPVVGNAILTSGNRIEFIDDVSWVGHSYTLHDFGDYKIIDSAQRVERNQFTEANDNDLMIFSFYPTKPVGSCDGGMIVSNDKEKIERLRSLAYNGMTTEKSNWDRKLIEPGYKFYMNSIQADIALRNLSVLDSKNNRLAEIREEYNHHFDLQNTSSYLYQVEVENNQIAMDSLKKKGISCGIHYSCLHKEEIYSDLLWNSNSFAKSLEHKKHSLSIPFHEELNQDDVHMVMKNIQERIKI